MRWTRHLWMRLQTLFTRHRFEEQLSDEIRFHLDHQIAENIAAGMSPEDARHAALRLFGNVKSLNEQTRQAWGWVWLDQLGQDLRFALRQVFKNPGFSLTSVLSLALGIGATVAVFSVIYGTILHPWPYAGADRIARIWTVDNHGDDGLPSLTGSEVQWLSRSRAIEDVFAFTWENLSTTGSDVPEDVTCTRMTGNAFASLGMRPFMGRALVPSDTPDGRAPQPLAVLSYKFWQRYFGGDPGVVGKTIELDHKTYEIIGVMPPRFTWYAVDLYLPLSLTQDPAAHYLTAVKLREGVTPERADAEFTPLFQQFAKDQHNYYPPQFRVSVRTITDYYVRGLGRTLTVLFAAVGLLLAIGCGNVSILLLARGTAREHEFAVRSAVGASRMRLVRQLLTESLVLAATGAALGVLLSYRAVALIVARLPDSSFPTEAVFHVNVPTLLFSVCMALLCGILFGLFPAFEISQPKTGHAMQSGAPKVAGNVRSRRIHGLLIAGEIALTLLLLTAAGGAVEGLSRMMNRPLGYDPHHIVSVIIPLHKNAHTTWEERGAYFAQLRQSVAAMPGVVSAAISSNATPPRNGHKSDFDILGENAQEHQQASMNLVSPEYFAALSIPLVEGRLWDQSEIARGANLIVVNQTLARRYFPNIDAVGHSLRFAELKTHPPELMIANGGDGWLEIIGVARDVVDDGLDKPIAPAAYLPYTLVMWDATQVLVHTSGDPLAMLYTIRQRIATVDRDQEIFSRVDDLETWITQEPEIARLRLISILFAAFSGLALALAAVGLFSVLSYSVAQRTREIGIRVALGAQPSDVMGIVALSSAVSVCSGLALGFALCIGFNGLIARWIENGANDARVVLLASFVMVLAASLACVIPAIRALSVDPMTALRSE